MKRKQKKKNENVIDDDDNDNIKFRKGEKLMCVEQVAKSKRVFGSQAFEAFGLFIGPSSCNRCNPSQK